MRLNSLRWQIVLLALSAVAFHPPPSLAGQSVWQPSPDHEQIPIWPGAIPDARPLNGPEIAGLVDDPTDHTKKQLIGGKPWTYVNNVSRPTMMIYSPKGASSGAAVIVFPGGGYNVLAIDHEGSEACDWLTARGITCVLLKYRVPCVKVPPYYGCPTAFEDAQRTMGLVRHEAATLHVDPQKIGVLGFSAGGHMVVEMSTHGDKRTYAPIDAADAESLRPDFAIALYPGHLVDDETNFVLDPAINVTKDTPPTFLVQAEDDPVDFPQNTLVYYAALQKAGVPAEMHMYPKGGHGFGFRPWDAPITHWPLLLEAWLHAIGLISN